MSSSIVMFSVSYILILIIIQVSADSSTYKFNGHDPHDHYETDGGLHDQSYYASEQDDVSAMSPDESKLRLAMLIDESIDKDGDSFVSDQELNLWMDKMQQKYIKEDVEHQWFMVKSDKKKNENKMAWDEFWHTNYNFIEELGDKVDLNGRDNLNRSYELILVREKRRWTVADEDKDGVLTKEEFMDFLHPEENRRMIEIVVDETFDDMDKDNDGRVSLDEYLQDLEVEAGEYQQSEREEFLDLERKVFSTQRDLNKDDYIDREEMLMWLSDTEQTNPSRAESRHLMEEADTNGDGKLSKEEIMKAYELFVNSQVTDFGEALLNYKKPHHDEL